MRILITEVAAEVAEADVGREENITGGGAVFLHNLTSVTPGRKTLMEKVRRSVTLMYR